MRLGDRRVAIALCAIAALPFTSSAGWTQQAVPVDRVPEGRRLPGWAVDTFAPLKKVDRGSTPGVLESFFDERGIQTTSVPAERLAYPGVGSLSGVQVGRAFLKVDQPSRTVFIMEMTQRGRDGFSCLAELRVGGVKAGNLNYYNTYMATPTEQSAKTIALVAGYYRIEYVAVCNGSPQSFRIQIRDEIDVQPRAFGQQELFHVKL